MNNRWLICNEGYYRRMCQSLFEFQVKRFGDYVLLYQGESELSSDDDQNDIFIFTDGYLLPRNGYFELDQNRDITGLIGEFFHNGIEDIYRRIKGIYVIILMFEGSLSVLTDHLGLYKVFYSAQNGIITNDLTLISHGGFTIDAEALAQHDFFQHFIGTTPYKGISVLKMGTSYALVGDKIIEKYTYDLSPERFYGLSSNHRCSSDHLVEVFLQTIKNYLMFFDTDAVTMTLTGGGDTRAILAALLSLGIRPNCFTFGSSRSRDVEASSRIAYGLKLNYKNHTYNNITAAQYSQMVDNVINLGNPLIHLHRAHRLESAKREREQRSDQSMVFMGCMGGDLIKGVHLNDYIISEYVRRHYFENERLSSVFSSMLNDRFFIPDPIDQQQVLSAIEATSFAGSSRKQTEFDFAVRLIGSFHDYQDIFLFSKVFGRCMVPFFDIDFIEALFGSEMNLFFCNRTSPSFRDQLRTHSLQMYIVHKLYPELLGYNYANGYSGNDFLHNRKMYFLKRGIVYLYDKIVPPEPNFPYDKWFVQYLHEALQKMEPVCYLYDINKLKSNLQDINGAERNEGYFHKFSNPLNHALYFNRSK